LLLRKPHHLAIPKWGIAPVLVAMQNGLGDDATFQGDGHADAAVLGISGIWERNGAGNGAPRDGTAWH